jgi:transcriptional regulator with GAF, ATPase, and Fis domain
MVYTRAMDEEHSGNGPTRSLRQRLRDEGLVARSAAMARVVRDMEIIAPTHHTVLLMGEAGTGRKRIARVIHDHGPRRDRMLAIVDCSVLRQANWDESDVLLFGAKRSATNGVDRDQVGLVTVAEHGTLFLREVGDLPLRTQAKLLLLLQDRLYHPLGSSSPVVADIRVIATTSVDLERAVGARTFRCDLFYRISSFPIQIPALAERREDIAEMAVAFCIEACRREGHGIRLPSRDALSALEEAAWPGNVRQLEDTVQGAVLRAIGEGAVEIERRHLFPERTGGMAPEGTDALNLEEATQRFERRQIEEALKRSRKRHD